MSDKMLYIVRGLPGSGKSTLAQTMAAAMNAPHFEEDMWLYDNGVYSWTPVRMIKAVAACAWACFNEMHAARPSIVVSNVFEEERMLEPYKRYAEQFGYNVTYIIVENRRSGVNIHNVSDEALEQMRADFQVRL